MVAQGIHRDTQMHLDQLISQNLHMDLIWSQTVGGSFTAERQRERGKRAVMSSPEKKRAREVGALHWSRALVITGGEEASRQRAGDRDKHRKKMSGSGSGWERFFLKCFMCAPDSLQCLSGAHRTAHSSCPVNRRTAHTGKGDMCAPTGAPNNAQCSVRCTPDCPVTPGRGDF
jgi:hypothetical protein